MHQTDEVVQTNSTADLASPDAMHVYAIVAILISVLASQRPADGYILSALAPYTPIVHAPVTGSTPSSPSLSPKIKDGLE